MNANRTRIKPKTKIHNVLFAFIRVLFASIRGQKRLENFMVTRTFKTNLRCNGCVETLRPILNADPSIAQWEADVTGPDKLLRVTGERATREHMEAKLSEAGYHVLDEVKPTVSLPLAVDTPPASEEPKPSYFPLL